MPGITGHGLGLLGSSLGICWEFHQAGGGAKSKLQVITTGTLGRWVPDAVINGVTWCPYKWPKISKGLPGVMTHPEILSGVVSPYV